MDPENMLEGGEMEVAAAQRDMYKRCELEPIHLLPTVQDVGAVVAVQRDGAGVPRIVQASRNAGRIFRVSFDWSAFLGEDLRVFFSDAAQIDRLLEKAEERAVHVAHQTYQGKQELSQGMDRHRESDQGMTVWWQGWYGDSERDAYIRACDVAGPSEKRWARGIVSLAGHDESCFLTAAHVKHGDAGLLVVEVEEVDSAVSVSASSVLESMRQLVSEIQVVDTVGDLCNTVARNMREMSGYDRVMVYKFREDGSGCVVAESTVDGFDFDRFQRFLGVCFPENDVPAQSKRLFQRNRLRVVHSVATEQVRLEPALVAGLPVDHSDTRLRGISGFYTKYLENMGVTASATAAIIVEGKLWGLLTCHCYGEPFTVDPSMRMKLSIASMLLQNAIEAHDRRTLQKRLSSMDAMLEDVSGKPAEDSTTLSENRIFQLAEVIRESTESDSVLICEGEGGRSLGKESTSNSDFTRANSRFHAIRCIGAPVDEEYVCAATKALFAAKRSSGAPSNRYVVSCRSVTRELSDLGTPTVPPGGITPAGIAVIHSASLELIFVRKECEMKEKWVVRHGHEESKNHYKRLQPRASFAAYRRSISGCSQEWSLQDMQVLFLAHQRLMALLEMQHSDTLKRFLATMSHELRTPFSGLMGILDILMLDDSLHGQAHDLLRVARSSAGQMLNILDDILTVCKLGEDSVILNVGPFQLWEPTRQAHSLFVARARSDSVTLTKIEEVIGGMDLEKDKGLLGDHRKILQACINLLGNAFKFLWKGESGPGHVQLKSAILPSLQALVGVVREDRRRFDAATNEVEELDRILTENFAALVGNQACDGSPKGTGQRVWLLVSVEDNGIGISARDIKRLGEPFKQVHDGAKRPVGGTGLGLHISRRFVEIMGGCLWAFSTSGVPEENCSNRGTMVQFAVPLEPVETGKEAPQHVSRTQEMREEPSKLGGRLSAASIPPPIIAESAVYSEHQEAVKRKAESPGASSKKQAKLEISPTMVKTPEMKAALSQDRPVILIADDNRTNLLVLSKMLKDLAPFLYCMSVSSGFAMVQAHESFAAENGKESQLALIITDFHMPNLDGIEALEIIRKRDPSTPAFVVTADVFLSSERLSQCQPVEVLMKPFSRDTLARALEKHIAQYRAVQ